MTLKLDIFRLRCIKNLYILIFVTLGFLGLGLMALGSLVFIFTEELFIGKFSVFWVAVFGAFFATLSFVFFSLYEKKKKEIKICKIPDDYKNQ